jgi:tetratricopeptide (TPR) repeat protein
LHHCPDDAQLLTLAARLHRERKEWSDVEDCLVRLSSNDDRAQFASVAEGLRGYRARHDLAVLYEEQGRSAEAEAQWRAALDEEPGFKPSWNGLGELYLNQRRFTEVDDVVRHLENGSGNNGTASVGAVSLRARVHLKRQEFDQARDALEKALEAVPSDVYLWRLLSHVWLQEAKYPERAEDVLRKVLELDPENGEARQNLAVLLKRRNP